MLGFAQMSDVNCIWNTRSILGEGPVYDPRDDALLLLFCPRPAALGVTALVSAIGVAAAVFAVAAPAVTNSTSLTRKRTRKVAS